MADSRQDNGNADRVREAIEREGGLTDLQAPGGAIVMRATPAQFLAAARRLLSAERLSWEEIENAENECTFIPYSEGDNKTLTDISNVARATGFRLGIKWAQDRLLGEATGEEMVCCSRTTCQYYYTRRKANCRNGQRYPFPNCDGTGRKLEGDSDE